MVNVLQWMNVYAYFIVVVLTTVFFISVYYYLNAICDDFQCTFNDLDRLNAGEFAEQYWSTAKTKLNEAINLQSFAVKCV